MTDSCCSEFSDAAGQQFDTGKVTQELAQYRRNGPGKTTRLLRDGLVQAGLVRGSLLDVGAGFGALTFDLLERGAERAVAIDASLSYANACADEATRRGHTSRLEIVHGDFVFLSARLPSATIVTLDRVVCCYPFVEALLTRVLARAERGLALSYPRDAWYVRVVIAAENLKRRISGNSFRTFVHSPRGIERQIRDAGFKLAGRRTTLAWAADVYSRR